MSHSYGGCGTLLKALSGGGRSPNGKKFVFRIFGLEVHVECLDVLTVECDI